MTLTTTQERAIIQIKKMEVEFGRRWFVVDELLGFTLNTTKALANKGYLDEKTFDDIPYYIGTW